MDTLERRKKNAHSDTKTEQSKTALGRFTVFDTSVIQCKHERDKLDTYMRGLVSMNEMSASAPNNFQS